MLDKMINSDYLEKYNLIDEGGSSRTLGYILSKLNEKIHSLDKLRGLCKHDVLYESGSFCNLPSNYRYRCVICGKVMPKEDAKGKWLLTDEKVKKRIK